ncbi:MAG: ATP-binding cassette domain-containing protein [Rhodobacteraceae bacterium]|nr:ATP-binding cassette domain-containing protein [Paracoccaceae bacterium]
MPVFSVSDAALAVEGQPFLGPIRHEATLSGITCILGPNGAGKSLFLALAHGIARPETGTVTWDGVPAVANKSTRSYMHQQTVVLRRTVRANVAYPLTHPDSNLIDGVLADMQLAHKAQSPAATLSGGEMRRMAFARALVTEPQVLILDEPFAGLDPASAAKIEAAIVSCSMRVPILMSTHDLALACRIAHQILFFSKGQLCDSAPAAAFFEGPVSAAARAFLIGKPI